jgi:hypothetical protein
VYPMAGETISCREDDADAPPQYVRYCNQHEGQGAIAPPSCEAAWLLRPCIESGGLGTTTIEKPMVRNKQGGKACVGSRQACHVTEQNFSVSPGRPIRIIWE